MKHSLLALLFALPTFAQAAPIVCDNGQPDNDNAIQITLNQKSRSNAVDLQLWETFYKIPAAKIVKNGNSLAIVGQKLTGFAEGEKEDYTVDALLVYSPEKRTLTTTLLFDGEVNRAAEVLNCR